ncbi:DNA primase [Rhizohabitans arisaemae]|uniref:DNA primase n=1 Tax=Rhizohabitans arisaemae TaxID=2720610 RepID=UPI0024B04B97|nr:DNA primase [Rhizohabitans arisaemae]
MAGRISDEDIALIRERSPIHEVIGDHLQLRSAGGGSLKGLCPFHDEKTPSFNVTPARGLYYCHGCGVGGDVIDFTMKIDHLSFAEAVERLAARAKIQLRYEQGGYVPRREQGERTRLVEAHKAAEEFYREKLGSPGASAGRRFLAERGFEAADAEYFGVGYAPAEWDALSRHLVARGFAVAELIKAGIAKEGRRGPIDRFRNRLVWPIRDLTGDVIGFGARKLDESEDGPKYLNTPESPIYKKSTVLYGVDFAKKNIAKESRTVVVEGYTDVMACHLAGVGTAVATCGTAFGGEHVKVIRRLMLDQDAHRGQIIFTFDGDLAGQKAALRAFDEEQKFVTQTFVAIQPDGLDPCELRVKQGDAAVRKLIEEDHQPLFYFAIQRILARYDLTTNEARLNALDEAAPLVATIKDKALRQMYAVDLDRWLGLMDERFVLRRISEIASRATAGAGRAAPAVQAARRKPDAADPAVHVEIEALKLAIQHPALLGPGFDILDESVFTVAEHAAVHRLIVKSGGVAAAGAGGREWVELLREAADTQELRSLVTRFAVDALRSDGEAEERYGAAMLARLEELAVVRGISQVKARLQRLNPVTEQQEYNRLFGELIALEQHRRTLRERAIGSP